MPEPAISAMLHHCHRRRYPSGAVIFAPGDPGETLYHVVSGSLAVSISEGDRRRSEMILGYLNPGDFIGEVCVFTGPARRRVTVRTKEATVLAEIDYARLRHLLEADLAKEAPGILLALGAQIARKLLELRDTKVRRLAFEDATARVMHCLIDLCSQPNAMTHPDGWQLRVSRQEISRIVGCSREMAGQIIARLAAEGKISAHGKTIVVRGVRPFSKNWIQR